MKIEELSILFTHETESSKEAEKELIKNKFHKELELRGMKLEEVDYDDVNLWRAVYK